MPLKIHTNVQVAADGSKADGTVTSPPFPEQRVGTRSGTNGLYRLNYFNGRFLTAEALRREQVYWDTRARLVAQTHGAGIAWGLSLNLPVFPAPFRDQDVPAGWLAEGGVGGLSQGTPVQLQPGLAFDDVGRPIVVGAPFTFTFAQLVEQARVKPQVVVGGGTRFSPCVCLVPAPTTSSGSGPAMKPGAYLLIIEPGECPEGEAKVYGDVCASANAASHCETDGWRGTFGLSLAYVPIQPPVEDIRSIWELRGLLSAYWFDVWEHNLVERWDPDFPAGFCSGPEPRLRSPGAVALAMVYLGADGSVLFVDPWIPRRPQVATASASWAATLRGAPSPAACVARLHQFQCQLQQGLAQSLGPQAANKRRNLIELGFRHIPPFGFLPVDAPPSPLAGLDGGGRKDTIGLSKDAGSAGLSRWLFSEAAAIEQARKQAQAYFAGTSVLTITHVAPLDDDILEDMVRSGEKDPIPLYEWERPERKWVEALCRGGRGKGGESPTQEGSVRARELRSWLLQQDDDEAQAAGRRIDALLKDKQLDLGARVVVRVDSTTGQHAAVLPVDGAEEVQPLPPIPTATWTAWGNAATPPAPVSGVGTNTQIQASSPVALAAYTALCWLLKNGGLTMEQLINREISVVKLIVPMEGLRRSHPILGKVEGDAVAQLLNSWATLSASGVQASRARRAAELFLGDFMGWAAQPRRFVFYVKQRLVMLEWVYLLLDAVMDLLALLTALGDWGSDKDPHAAAPLHGQPGEDGRSAERVGILALNSVRPAHQRVAGAGTVSTTMGRTLLARNDVQLTGLVRSTMENPTLRRAVLDAAVVASPELGTPAYWKEWDRAVAEETPAGAAPTSPEAIAARDRATDRMMDRYAGTALLKVVGVAAPSEVDRLASELKVEAASRVKRDASGKVVDATLEFEAFKPTEVAKADSEEASRLLTLARAELGKARVHELVGEVPSTEPVERLLAVDRTRVAELVGETSARKVVEAVKASSATIVKASRELGDRGALDDASFRETYSKALASSEGDTRKALEAVAETRGTSAATRTTAKTALSLAEALPGESFDRFWSGAMMSTRGAGG